MISETGYSDPKSLFLLITTGAKRGWGDGKEPHLHELFPVASVGPFSSSRFVQVVHGFYLPV